MRSTSRGLDTDIKRALGTFCSVLFADDRYPFMFNHVREDAEDGKWVEPDGTGVPNRLNVPFVLPKLLEILVGMERERRDDP
jgi:hypothetical protein